MMSAENPNLLPEQTEEFTLERLSKFTVDPIYVSVAGKVFDVSLKKDLYGPNGSYSIFAGKDASKGLGMSDTDPKHAVPDISTLDQSQIKVLDSWFDFFSRRYNIVGRVVDVPEATSARGNRIRADAPTVKIDQDLKGTSDKLEKAELTEVKPEEAKLEEAKPEEDELEKAQPEEAKSEDIKPEEGLAAS